VYQIPSESDCPHPERGNLSGRSGELGGSISTAEGVALLVAALVAGVLVGLSLSVRG